jgi:hypothetical protein
VDPSLSTSSVDNNISKNKGPSTTFEDFSFDNLLFWGFMNEQMLDPELIVEDPSSPEVASLLVPVQVNSLCLANLFDFLHIGHNAHTRLNLWALAKGSLEDDLHDAIFNNFELSL